MKTTFKRNIIIGFSFSLLLLILSSVASFVSIRNLLSSSGWVDHTYKVIARLDDLNAVLIEAESAQRGYLLTDDPQFTASLQPLFDRIDKGIAGVEQLTNDSPSQKENIKLLKEAIGKRMKILKAAISYKQQKTTLDVSHVLNGKQYMDVAKRLIADMVEFEKSLLVTRTASMQRFAGYTPVLIVMAAILSLIITIVFYMRIAKDLNRRMALQKELQDKDKGINRRIDIIKGLADKISSGDYQIRVDDEGRDGLGNLSESLNKMARSLEYGFGLLSDKEWLQSAIAGLNTNMLGEQEVEELCYNIINFTAEKTNSQVGALYLINSIGNLSLVSSFALNAGAPSEVMIGEGIVGQCARDGRKILLQQVSSTQFTINFATGEIKPSSIIVVPLKHQGKLKGVIQLGSLLEYTSNEQLFLAAVSEQTGIVIASSQSRRTLQELLEETQSQSEELQVQHSELESINEQLKAKSQKLQVSDEELRVQQEELMQTNQELQERTTLLEEKNQVIEERNQEIQFKAKELEISGKYKSEFLANMSHELRTPLNSILLLSRLLSENNGRNLSVDQVEYAQVIQSSGHGLLSLIDEILDLSKIESGKMQMEYAMVPLQEIINDIDSLFAPVAKDKKINFSIRVGPGTPSDLEIDKLRLEQIIKNLVSNAIKFTQKGEVALDIEKHPSNPAMIAFKVKDTGIGIQADKQKLIFEAFQQADGSTRRQYGGTGLGLSISRELAKLLGGYIELNSELGKGSEFMLSIPLERPAEQEEEDFMQNTGTNYNYEPAAEVSEKERLAAKALAKKFRTSISPGGIPDDRGNIGLNDKTILIIEDDVFFAKTLLDFSRQHGYKGVVAVRGDEGVELAREIKPVGILLDIMLPVKDGWEVMKDLKASLATRQIPVHIMSSLEVKKQSISSGAIDFINKPLALEKMKEVFLKIEEILSHDLKKVLIVEESAKHAAALSYFLRNFDIQTEVKSSVSEGIAALLQNDTSCVILDTGLSFEKSEDGFEQVKKTPGLESLPIIIFTGRNLSRSEETRARQYADSIVFKTAHSYQRILDEVGLFLHIVEEKKAFGGEDKYKKLGGIGEVLMNKKVLIADDDVRNIFSLSKALENAGMTVISATDGREALQQLKENPSVNIILMDMMMPEMDGYESMKTIRNMQDFRNLPIIAVTAKAMAGDREKCISSGASDYITKPVDTDQLLSLLRVWLYEN